MGKSKFHIFTEISRESKMGKFHTEADKVRQRDILEHACQDKEISQEQKARIEDLKTQIQALYEQLHTKKLKRN